MASSRPFQSPLLHSPVNGKYDTSLGREIDRSDGAGSRTTVYNAYGEVTSERFPLATNSSAVISRTYDSLGRPKTILLKGTTAAVYTYDAATGRYATVKNNSATVTYSYLDKTNLPLVQTWQKGTSSAFLTVSNTYDAYNRLTLINANSSNQAAYVYDSLGRRTSATLQDDTAWNYSYNQRSEITSAIRKNASNVTQNNMRYVFDGIGNRTSSYEDATSKTYDANSLNQYTGIYISGGSNSYPLYDDDGNMTQFDSSTYTYDAENRLISAVNGTKRVECGYDALSRRVFKKVYLNNTLSKHERYVYDGMKLLATYNAKSSFAKINSFLWQPFGLDVPLIMSYNSTVYGYLVDANKNVLGLFNPSKSRVATYLYGPFGQKLSESGTIAANNPLQFSSEQFDADLGFVYYNFRYYFPAIGKWLTKDPIGEMGGLNLYAFCGNNAVNSWDENGEKELNASSRRDNLKPVENISTNDAFNVYKKECSLVKDDAGNECNYNEMEKIILHNVFRTVDSSILNKIFSGELAGHTALEWTNKGQTKYVGFYLDTETAIIYYSYEGVFVSSSSQIDNPQRSSKRVYYVCPKAIQKLEDEIKRISPTFFDTSTDENTEKKVKDKHKTNLSYNAFLLDYHFFYPTKPKGIIENNLSYNIHNWFSYNIAFGFHATYARNCTNMAYHLLKKAGCRPPNTYSWLPNMFDCPLKSDIEIKISNCFYTLLFVYGMLLKWK